MRYRGAVPEARTKFEAEQAETKIKLSVFEGRYGKQAGDKGLVEFIDDVYLPWARQNKRSWKHDNFRARKPHVSAGQASATILPQTMSGQSCWPL